MLWTAIAVGAAFILNLIVYIFRLEKLKPFFKPLAMLTIIVWSLSAANWEISLPLVLLIAAQVFGLAGDVFLLFPGKWFMWGLGAFLLGHFFYVDLMGLLLFQGSQTQALLQVFPWGYFVGIAVWAASIMLFYRTFKPALTGEGASKSFWIAVQVYAFALSGLLAFSVIFVLSKPGFSVEWLLLPVGGVLFFLSDFALAYNRFIKQTYWRDLLVWVTYHLAQISLALGLISLIS